MIISVLRKRLFALAVLLLASGSFVACSDDDDPPAPGTGYPKEVNVEYKVTVLSGNISNCRIDWFNETGGVTTEHDVPTPASRGFKKKVNQYDHLGVTATSSVGGRLKLEIVVNGDVVESQEFADNNVVAGSIQYVFP